MAYIDPDGMFGGDRMAMLSDKARWAWPWFWTASNDVGRIELNYHKVVDRAFAHFKNRPTEEQFFAWMKEYRDCWLLFIYDSEERGRWGQWDVPEKFLPRFRKRADEESPAPMARHFLDWRASYQRFKKNRAIEKSCIPNVGMSEPVSGQKPDKHRTRKQKTTPMQGNAHNQLNGNDCSVTLSDQSGEEGVRTSLSTVQDKNVHSLNVYDNSHGINGKMSGQANSRETAIDKDIDIDIEIDTKTHCPPNTGGQSVVRKKRTTRQSVDSWVIGQHDQWYEGFWNHQKKQRSLDAYARRIAALVTRGMSREGAAEFLRERCADDRRRFESTSDWSWRRNLHPTTWLNQELWTDEAKAPGYLNGDRPAPTPTAAERRRAEVLRGLQAIDRDMGRVS